MAFKLQFATPDTGLGGIPFAVKAVAARAARQPAALPGSQFHRAERIGAHRSQAQCKAAVLQLQHHSLLVELLQTKLDTGAQAQRGAANAQLGAAVGPGAQAVAGGHRPVA